MVIMVIVVSMVPWSKDWVPMSFVLAPAHGAGPNEQDDNEGGADNDDDHDQDEDHDDAPPSPPALGIATAQCAVLVARPPLLAPECDGAIRCNGERRSTQRFN